MAPTKANTELWIRDGQVTVLSAEKDNMRNKVEKIEVETILLRGIYSHIQLVRPETKEIKDQVWIGTNNETPGCVAKKLQEAEELLSDALCEITVSYDSDAGLFVSGWRSMTDTEVKKMEEELPKHYSRQEELAKANQAMDRRKYEELKQRFE